MSVNEKMTAIADAIREKTGKTDQMTLDQMPDEIAGIQSGGGEDNFVQRITDTLTSYTNNDITKLCAYSFAGCSSLENVSLPEVTELSLYSNAVADRQSSAFQHCTNLKHVTLPKCETIYSHAFYGCSSLESISLPSLTRCTARSNSGHIFCGCTKLKTIYAPKLIIVLPYTFSNTLIEEFDFPELQTISNWAFASSKIKEAYFPSVTIISDNAFNSCTSLTKADFRDISSLTTNVFFKCDALEALILRKDTLITLGNINSISSSLIAKGTGYIYVPAALIEDYKVATNWITYANQFRAIEDYPEICGGDKS